MSSVSRRQMLGLMGGAIVGAGAGVLAGTRMAEGGMPVEEKPFSWQPHALDVKEIQPIAHERFYHQGFGCGYGVFYSIIGIMGNKFGDPYKSFPYSMMEMGKSGVSEWGTLCGALLGGVAALSLFWGRKDRDPMVDELFRWYEVTEFPMYKPVKGLPVGLDIDLPTSVSDSVLCHISVGRWSSASGFPAQSKQRSERCARITADVAKKTVEIINAKIDGTFKVLQTPSEVRLAQKDDPALKGKMDCAICHTEF